MTIKPYLLIALAALLSPSAAYAQDSDLFSIDASEVEAPLLDGDLEEDLKAFEPATSPTEESDGRALLRLLDDPEPTPETAPQPQVQSRPTVAFTPAPAPRIAETPVPTWTQSTPSFSMPTVNFGPAPLSEDTQEWLDMSRNRRENVYEKQTKCRLVADNDSVFIRSKRVCEEVDVVVGTRPARE